ncbi:hypothetical protein pb186bvf_009438 [Paramecium bursaria]
MTRSQWQQKRRSYQFRNRFMNIFHSFNKIKLAQ